MNCLYCSTTSHSFPGGGTGLGVAPAVAICQRCGAGLCPRHLILGEVILCATCAARPGNTPLTREKGSPHVV